MVLFFWCYTCSMCFYFFIFDDIPIACVIIVIFCSGSTRWRQSPWVKGGGLPTPGVEVSLQWHPNGRQSPWAEMTKPKAESLESNGYNHGGVMYGWFHLPWLVKYSLYPFDSPRSLRVTAIGKFVVAFGCGSKMLPLRGLNKNMDSSTPNGWVNII